MPQEDNSTKPASGLASDTHQPNQPNIEGKSCPMLLAGQPAQREESESHLILEPVDLFGIKLKLL